MGQPANQGSHWKMLLKWRMCALQPVPIGDKLASSCNSYGVQKREATELCCGLLSPLLTNKEHN